MFNIKLFLFIKFLLKIIEFFELINFFIIIFNSRFFKNKEDIIFGIDMNINLNINCFIICILVVLIDKNIFIL